MSLAYHYMLMEQRELCCCLMKLLLENLKEIWLWSPLDLSLYSTGWYKDFNKSKMYGVARIKTWQRPNVLAIAKGRALEKWTPIWCFRLAHILLSYEHETFGKQESHQVWRALKKLELYSFVPWATLGLLSKKTKSCSRHKWVQL